MDDLILQSAVELKVGNVGHADMFSPDGMKSCRVMVIGTATRKEYMAFVLAYAKQQGYDPSWVNTQVGPYFYKVTAD